jgi:hypothetical protein
VVVVLFVVEDYINGVRVGEVVKLDSSDGDLFTNWILRMFYALFAYARQYGSVSFRARDDTGVERVFDLKSAFGCEPEYTVDHIFNTVYCLQFVRVRYGTSSTPPSRTDFRLLSEIYVDSNPRLILDEGGGRVVVESTVSFGADTTICEVGLSLAMTVARCDVCGEVLLDRTVFPRCRDVPANTPYTVRYVVQL